MKNIKTKEELLREEFFRPGSFVLVLDFRSNVDELNKFLKNNIGQILRQHITNDDIMIVIYENIPKNLLSYFNYYGNIIGKIVPKNRLSLSSDKREELEEYLISQKYNI